MVLRRHLRVLAIASLLLQVAWLMVLVPRDCCAKHRPAAASCHEAPSAAPCPMRAADGTPCPMHRGGGHNADHDGADCRLSGLCDGPMAAFLALLSHHGVLPDSASPIPNLNARSVEAVLDVHQLGRVEPPDSPPPRA
jgi:hypothetical protein